MIKTFISLYNKKFKQFPNKSNKIFVKKITTLKGGKLQTFRANINFKNLKPKPLKKTTTPFWKPARYPLWGLSIYLSTGACVK